MAVLGLSKKRRRAGMGRSPWTPPMSVYSVLGLSESPRTAPHSDGISTAVSVEVHHQSGNTIVADVASPRIVADGASPRSHNQGSSSSRHSPFSLDRTPPSPQPSTPSPTSLQRPPPVAPKYTPPPSYSVAVGQSDMSGRGAKMPPMSTKSAGAQRNSPSGTDVTHKESAIPVPIVRCANSMPTSRSGPAAASREPPLCREDSHARLESDTPAAPHDSFSRESSSSPFTNSPHKLSKTPCGRVKSPLGNRDRPPIPRNRSNSHENWHTPTNQSGAFSAFPRTTLDYLGDDPASDVDSNKHEGPVQLGPERSGSWDSVVRTGSDGNSLASSRDGLTFARKAVGAANPRSAVSSPPNTNMTSPQNTSLSPRKSAGRGVTSPTVLENSQGERSGMTSQRDNTAPGSTQRKSGWQNGYAPHHLSYSPTAPSVLPCNTDPLTPHHHFAQSTHIMDPRQHQSPALDENKAHRFSRTFDSFQEQTVTFV